jgi:hypothetical protein
MLMAPTKQNILCDGKSAGEMIDAHEDFSFRQARQMDGSANKKRTVQDDLVTILKTFFSPSLTLRAKKPEFLSPATL